MADFTLSDYLQGRNPLMDDEAAPSPRENPRMRDPRYAFETDNPVVNYLRRFNRGEETVDAPNWLKEAVRGLLTASMAMRPGVAPRMANDFLLARRAPNGVVDWRLARDQRTDQRSFPPSRPREFLRRAEPNGMINPTTPQEMGFYGPSAPANSPAGAAHRQRLDYNEALARQELRRSMLEDSPPFNPRPGGE